MGVRWLACVLTFAFIACSLLGCGGSQEPKPMKSSVAQSAVSSEAAKERKGQAPLD
jgi:hypothetical protein